MNFFSTLLFFEGRPACGILVLRPWTEREPPALEVWRLNYWDHQGRGKPLCLAFESSCFCVILGDFYFLLFCLSMFSRFLSPTINI